MILQPVVSFACVSEVGIQPYLQVSHSSAHTHNVDATGITMARHFYFCSMALAKSPMRLGYAAYMHLITSILNQCMIVFVYIYLS